MFARHSNPWSAWTRLASAPLVLVPVWTRRASHAALVGAWLLANPVVFPEPRDEQNWATRAILGEELWITHRPRDAARVVGVAGSAAEVCALIAAHRHRFRQAAVAVAAQMAITLAYWEMMARYLDRHRKDERFGG
jgi:hypothetical protein